MLWPGNKAFAFTIFYDPDSQTLEAGREVYALLHDLGFRTTKGVWPIRGNGVPSDHGGTCAEPEYRAWVQTLQVQGFEIGYHNATSHTSLRDETSKSLDVFEKYFGGPPVVMANHYFCDEAIYWNENRLSGSRRRLYNLLTLGKNRNKSYGHVPGHPYFWGDLCRERIRYVRNFAFGEINTLKACPWMPYHDPNLPYVNFWYASSEGAQADTFNRMLRESNQDRLAEEGGACIMYTHFGLGFVRDGELDRRFRDLMARVSKANGWFVPVSTLLDYLLARRGENTIIDAQRTELEWRWLWHKIRFGSA
jgi:hypothetical protein